MVTSGGELFCNRIPVPMRAAKFMTQQYRHRFFSVWARRVIPQGQPQTVAVIGVQIDLLLLAKIGAQGLNWCRSICNRRNKGWGLTGAWCFRGCLVKAVRLFVLRSPLSNMMIKTATEKYLGIAPHPLPPQFSWIDLITKNPSLSYMPAR